MDFFVTISSFYRENIKSRLNLKKRKIINRKILNEDLNKLFIVNGKYEGFQVIDFKGIRKLALENLAGIN